MTVLRGRVGWGQRQAELFVKIRFGALAQRLIWLAIAGGMTSCAVPSGPANDPRLAGPRDSDFQGILAPPRPPSVVIGAGQPAQIAARAATRLTTTALSEQRGARLVQIAAVPLLRSTPEGAAFLAMQGHRALSQGEPVAACPALSVAPSNAPTSIAAAEVSLTQCAAELVRRNAPETCGCRLIALDNALLAPIGRFSFAPAVSALLIERGKATRLIAESEVQNGIAITRLRNVAGEVGVLRATGNSDEISGVIDDVSYSGTRAPFGFRRGRLAERITMTSAAGERLSLLIGVERRDATPKTR